MKQEIQLNEETVSAGSPYKNYNPEAKGALATIRQLIFAGRYPEAQALAGEKILSKNGFGMPYQTVGSLRLDFPSLYFFCRSAGHCTPYCFSTGKTYFFRFPDLSSEGGCYRFWKECLDFGRHN